MLEADTLGKVCLKGGNFADTELKAKEVTDLYALDRIVLHVDGTPNEKRVGGFGSFIGGSSWRSKSKGCSTVQALCEHDGE